MFSDDNISKHQIVGFMVVAKVCDKKCERHASFSCFEQPPVLCGMRCRMAQEAAI